MKADKPVRFVRQKDASGCGLACAAMLAGTSYAKMEREYRKNWPEERGRYTELADVNRLLRPFKLTLSTGHRITHIDRIRHKGLLACNYSIATTIMHWVVVDPQWSPGQVIDPLSRKPGGRRSDLARIRPDRFYVLQQI